MTSLSDATEDQLLHELQKRGRYVFMSLSADDIIPIAEEYDAQITEEAARKAVYEAWDSCYLEREMQELIEGAIDRAVELSPELQGE